MNNIYSLLEKKARKREPFETSEEFKFFLSNRQYLSKIPRFSFLYDSEYSEFDVMRANIILHGYLNKTLIEEEAKSLNEYIKKGKKVDHNQFVNTIREKIIDLPYYQEGKNKIYIPFFSRPLNLIYLKESEKLLESPYLELSSSFVDSIIDPFDTFSFGLYNSYFTRLVLIAHTDRYGAYFHYDMNTIYIVNDQGRLDNKIVLFDKYLRHPSFNHMLDRIKPVVEAYFNNSRSDFINSLYENGFISIRLLNLLRKGEME